MDFAQLKRDMCATNSVDHIKALHDNVILQFSYDQDIQRIMLQKEQAQKSMMIRNYLKKYADDGLLNELRAVLETLGSTRDYVDVCIRGVIRKAQTEIYSLFTVFDTDYFRLDHMCTKHNGSATEEYFERASEVNNWRYVIDLETHRIVASAQQFISDMQPRMAKLPKDKFMVHPDYVVFCGELLRNTTVDAPTKRMRTV